MRKLGLWLAVSAALAGLWAPLAASPANAESMKPPVEINRQTKPVEEQLVCQCGCTMIVAVCDCGTADQMRADIAAQMDAGVPPATILAGYVAKYGEKVVAYPVKKGFNWTAWITPFAAVGAGALLLYYLLHAWVNRHQVAAGEEPVQAERLDAEEEAVYGERVREVLRKYY